MKFYRPRHIRPKLSLLLYAHVERYYSRLRIPDNCEFHLFIALMGEGWRFYVVDSADAEKSSWCDYTNRAICISSHAWRDRQMRRWIVAHEIAHAIAGFDVSHGPAFYAVFRKLCPKRLWKFERERFPRATKLAGL